MDLYLFKNFNNYYNRVIKRYDTLEEYKDNYTWIVKTNVNFVPGDCVNTTQILNIEVDWLPDYIIAVNPLDINMESMSRWFVMEATRTRGLQYTVQLRRDLIADFYNNIKDSPCFIEKAKLNPEDPAIFNAEDMTFNEIKMNEIPLYDETNTPWIVGYLPTDFGGQKFAITSTLPFDDAEHVSSISSVPLYSYNNKSIYTDSFQYSVTTYFLDGAFTNYLFKSVYNRDPYTANYRSEFFYDDSQYSPQEYNRALNAYIYHRNIFTASYTEEEAPKWFGTTLTSYIDWNAFENQLKIDLASSYSEEELKNLNNKLYYDESTGKYYIQRITKGSSHSLQVTTEGNIAYILKNGLVRMINENALYRERILTPLSESEIRQLYDIFKIDAIGTYYTVSITEINANPQYTYSINIPAKEQRPHLYDSPYDIFCMPYSDTFKIFHNGTEELRADKFLNLSAASEITKAITSSNVYDIQLLPYCPCRHMIMSDGTFDYQSNITGTIEDNNGIVVGRIFFANKSEDTFNIAYNINKSEDAVERKVNHLTKKYRLCSPNYNGLFEFSAEMNNGVQFFNVDFSYKPYQPYIHINPNFGGLYGQDFNDARGLICSGDFSLPTLDSAWANYQIQNKNYQAIFSRDIENMETNRNLGVGQKAFSTVTSAGMSAIANPILGGVTALSGAASIGFDVARSNEAIDYKKDQFGYQLGNIKAIPTSLTRVSSFNPNNKIVPFLEIYEAKSEEVTALRNKLIYNGMTVMRIGTISTFKSYYPSEEIYIKGKLIRQNNIENFHLSNEIANEMDKGVFL